MPVQVAFWIWIASAVLSLVSAVLPRARRARSSTSLRASKPQGLPPSQYDHTANTLITVLVVQLAVFARSTCSLPTRSAPAGTGPG